MNIQQPTSNAQHPSEEFSSLGHAQRDWTLVIGHSNSSFRSVAAQGFTLLEILLAVTIMAIVMTVTFMTFSAATTAWQKGTTLVDSLHHGDYVIQQLVMGLRSAYFPSDTKGGDVEYGFVHTDGGDGADAEDEISWVKLGGALVGRDCPFMETPHRVRFFVGSDEEGDLAATVVSWQLQGQSDDFDEDDVDPIFLSKRVVGFNCRMAWELDEEEDIEWLDEWEETNRVPTVVELTLYVEPALEGDDPVELKRIVGVSAGGLSWQ
jgi:prepilin-type N-terminal cleavage/methylation domain-containing protein